MRTETFGTSFEMVIKDKNTTCQKCGENNQIPYKKGGCGCPK